MEKAHQRTFDLVLCWALDLFNCQGMVPTVLHLAAGGRWRWLPLYGYAQPSIDANVEPLFGATTILAAVAVEHDAQGERDFQQAGRGVVDLAP